ncbi:phosphoserine phosphatase SerB [Stella sp.]|uniref:phosphoserine phosphatase SerB n=1 Tax=Stella sp. TaxID=2912054 RepID=UPI0035AF77E8
MTHVLTLVAGAAEGRLGPSVPAAAQAALAGAGARVGMPDWLAPGIACDLAYAADDPAAAHAAAALALAPAAIDVLATPVAGRRRRLLVCDMEATVVENELLDDMAALAGLGDAVAAVTRRAMAGEIDFAASLRHRTRLFAGYGEALLAAAARGIRPVAGARTLVATMRRSGALTALVSGGFSIFVDRVRAELGFDLGFANRLAWDGDLLTGEVAELAITAEGKRATLERLAAERHLSTAEAVAIGDGANDLAMLAAAGLAVGFRPKPPVAAAVANRIVHSDLTAVLYLQGYRPAEFAAG